MNAPDSPRVGIDVYLEWLQREAIPVTEDFGVDLLKIDFLDQAMVYQHSAGDGDLADVGRAMARMLRQVRDRLDTAGYGSVAFEFRQPYVSPAIGRYAEVLRANDCPADSVMNRLSTVDARLLAVGQVVHTDPMMWGLTGGAEAVAQQLYAGWFAVPQISMRLAELNQVQTSALRGLLALWQGHIDVTLDGVLQVSGGERGYDLVQSVRTDLDRSVIARYGPCVVDLDTSSTTLTTVINATAEDRVVLRTTRAIAEAVIRSAAAEEIAKAAQLGPGLVEIAVPAYGSVTVHRPEN